MIEYNKLLEAVMEKKKRTVTVLFSIELYMEMRKAAAELDMTLSEYIRQAVQTRVLNVETQERRYKGGLND